MTNDGNSKQLNCCGMVYLPRFLRFSGQPTNTRSPRVFSVCISENDVELTVEYVSLIVLVQVSRAFLSECWAVFSRRRSTIGFGIQASCPVCTVGAVIQSDLNPAMLFSCAFTTELRKAPHQQDVNSY